MFSDRRKVKKTLRDALAVEVVRDHAELVTFIRAREGGVELDRRRGSQAELAHLLEQQEGYCRRSDLPSGIQPVHRKSRAAQRNADPGHVETVVSKNLPLDGKPGQTHCDELISNLPVTALNT